MFKQSSKALRERFCTFLVLYQHIELSSVGFDRLLSSHGILYKELKSDRERYPTNALVIQGQNRIEVQRII
jgi:hypothetical protein